MGTIDKSIRLMLAIVVAVLYFSEVISGTAALILGVLAIVFMLTSFISFAHYIFLLELIPAKKTIKPCIDQ